MNESVQDTLKNVVTEVKFARSGNTVHIQNTSVGSITDQMPLGVWNLNAPGMMTPPSLTLVEDRFSDQKIFGPKTRRTIEFISSQLNGDDRCSVLLEGAKGLGKSMTMRHFANLAIDDGIPVILNNTSWLGEDFNNFIKSLGKVIVLMDEIDKTFKKDEDGGGGQEELLTFLDGVITHNARMIFTSNKSLNTYMYDRPSRIKFLMKHDHIPKDAMEEILDQVLVSQRETDRPKIETLISKAKELNFDNFLSFLKLLNENPGETVETLAEIFNISIDPEDQYKIVSYDINLSGKLQGFKEDWKSFNDESFLTKNTRVMFDFQNEKEECKSIRTSFSEMKRVNDDKLFYNQYKMEHKDGHIFVFEKVSNYEHNIANAYTESWL